MRPVVRGACPQTAAGDAIVFEVHGHARPHLIDRMGDFCSFCEVQLSGEIAVEHIRSQVTNPSLVCEWSNFLLACKSCNSTKGDKVDTEHDAAGYLWPHTHRTFDVFHYLSGGIVSLARIEDPELANRARAIADLVGLQRRPGQGLTKDQLLRGSDRRYEQRRKAWLMAEDARLDLARNDTADVRNLIVKLARQTGFWSVWMTVFAHDTDMRAQICQAFQGTATDRVDPLPAHCRTVP